MPYELVGDDLIGYGYSEIVGAQDFPGPSLARVPAMPGFPSGAQLRARVPTKAREWVLGFDSVTTIAAAASQNVTSRPQVTFRPDRLVVAGSVAASFLINDIKIGMASQLIAGVAVPAEVFGQAAVGVRLKLDTAQVSQDVILNVTNTSAGALRFNAAMIGPAVT